MSHENSTFIYKYILGYVGSGSSLFLLSFLPHLKQEVQTIKYKISYKEGFPGGPVVKNPSCKAGDTGSIPGWGTKIPYAAGHLSLHVTPTELAPSGTHAPQLQSLSNQRPCHSWKAHMPQQKTPHDTVKKTATTKTQRSQINKYIK